MKKVSSLLFLGLCGILLTACGGSNKGDASANDSIAESDPFEAGPGETKIDIKDGVTPLIFVNVQGGTFEMGDPDSRKHDDDIVDGPAHKVTLSDFQIAKIEVTQDQWQAVMGKNPSHEQDDPLKPVENISWNDTQEFIKKLGALTGHEFRLPTEAEWEFAARGGNKSKGTTYAGGDDAEEVANFHSAINPGPGSTAVVGCFKANELGLFDMSGNVAEWVQDFYAEYKAEDATDPKGPATGDYHVYRGGHCNKDAADCPITGRMKFAPVMPASSTGLRLVLVK